MSENKSFSERLDSSLNRSTYVILQKILKIPKNPFMYTVQKGKRKNKICENMYAVRVKRQNYPLHVWKKKILTSEKNKPKNKGRETHTTYKKMQCRCD